MTSTALSVIERQLAPLRPMFENLLRRTDITADRLIRTVIISCDNNPRLLECTPNSVIQSATTGAVLGLECDGVTGQGFLVPLSNKGTLKAQWWTGYKGYNTLAARVGLTIAGRVVREGDEFEFEEGSSGFVHHKKLLNAGTNRPIICAWATATAPSRSAIVCVMDLDEILAIKKRSPAVRAGRDTPWNDQDIGFAAMAEKTPKRRLARNLPLSAYAYHQAATVDEAAEELGQYAFIHPDRGVVIEGDSQPVETDNRPDQKAGPTISTTRPIFVVNQLDGKELRCNSAEQWRAAMVSAAQGISSDDNAKRFRDLNGAAVDGYARDFPDDAAAVTAAFERRLGSSSAGASRMAAAQQAPRGGPEEAGGEGLTLAGRTPPPADRGVHATEIVKPAGGKPDWRATRERLVSSFTALASVVDCSRFRIANSGAINMLPTAERDIFNSVSGAHERVLNGGEA